MKEELIIRLLRTLLFYLNTLKFKKALSYIVNSQPFFRKLLFFTEYEFSEKISTAGVDPGGKFFLNPYWLVDKEINDYVFVILHEVLHIALGHFLRWKNKDVILWNLATDLAINSWLVDAGFEYSRKLPVLLPQRFGFHKGLSAEEYYDLFLTRIKFKKESEKFFQRVKGFDEHYITSEQEELEEKWRKLIISAYNEAGERMQGKFPGWFIELIEKFGVPRIDWRSILRNFILSNVKQKINWAKPNRRYLVHEIYYPSRDRRMLELVVAVDTSGSISSRELEEFFGEINSILDAFDNYKIYLIQNDAKIQKVKEIKFPEKLGGEIKVKGRGGTDFTPLFDWVNEKGLRCPIIFFTDLCGTFPPYIPIQPVVWVSVGKEEAPFGLVIKYK